MVLLDQQPHFIVVHTSWWRGALACSPCLVLILPADVAAVSLLALLWQPMKACSHGCKMLAAGLACKYCYN